LIGTAAFLSMWMSNTAAVAVLIPIALAVAAPTGHEGFTKVLVLGTAYAATIGGVGSAIGTPANLLAIEFLDTFEVRHITFAGWFGYGLPMVATFLPVLAAYLWWRYGVRIGTDAVAGLQRAAQEQARDHRFGRDQARVLAVFAVVAVIWLLQSWHGVHPGIVALGGAVALALTRDIKEDDLGRLNWTALLTFGGGLSLGLALTETGVADWVATRLGTLGSLPDLAAVAIVAGVTLLLTTVASNTASAATLIPLSIPLAALLGVDVTWLVIVVAIASSVDFALIIGTPPTMMAYSTGLFRPAEILRAGAVLDVVGLGLLLTAVTFVWHVIGVI
ncbi:MAG: SLC13 family permease, partial [Nitriliruptorales bacterium]|nr:SLC13 family permease [Nitriliruptorales bacterium]